MMTGRATVLFLTITVMMITGTSSSLRNFRLNAGSCPAPNFRCRDNACLSPGQVCDNFVDCSTGEDERQRSCSTQTPSLYSRSCVFSCDRSTRNKRVIGGQRSTRGKYPFMAALFLSELKFPSDFWCGATIINCEWVLTAAHCVVHLAKFDLKVVVGLYDTSLSPGAQNIYDVEKVIIHPSYSRTHDNNDIALIKLSTPIRLSDSVQPICLPQLDSLSPGDELTLIGWGLTQTPNQWTSQQPARVLQEAQLPLVARSECNEKLGDYLIPWNMCTGTYGGQVDTCNGDSGGPIFREVGGVFEIVGISSWGHIDGCALDGIPSTHANVYYYNSWIEDTVSPY